MDGPTATGVAWRDEVREAVARLPERQRETLELREGEGFSYEQIAERLGTGIGAVAQLLERARINLYDELRGTALASVAAPSAECERALPLIAARRDGELDGDPGEVDWLDAHLGGCERCALAEEQMAEAAAFYRGEAPASTAPVERPGARRPSRRRMALADGLAALALGGVAIVLMAGGGSPDAAPPAAGGAARRNDTAAISHAHVVRAAHKARTAARHRRKRAKNRAGAAGGATIQTSGSASTPLYTPTQGSGGHSGGAPASSHQTSGGDAAVQPAKQKSAAKPAAKPKPPSSSAQAPQPAAQPAPEAAPPPAEEPTPPAEEPIAEHGHKGGPPGKPADRPPHK